jgi:hypothetical protein
MKNPVSARTGQGIIVGVDSAHTSALPAMKKNKKNSAAQSRFQSFLIILNQYYILRLIVLNSIFAHGFQELMNNLTTPQI